MSKIWRNTQSKHPLIKEIEIQYKGYEKSVFRYIHFIKETNLSVNKENADIIKKTYTMRYNSEISKFYFKMTEHYYLSLGKNLIELCN